VKVQPGFLLVHLRSSLEACQLPSKVQRMWRLFGCPARWATLRLGLPDLQAAACEPGQVGCQRCETAQQAAAVTASADEYFGIDGQNKFVSEIAKSSLTAFSFPAL